MFGSKLKKYENIGNIDEVVQIFMHISDVHFMFQIFQNLYVSTVSSYDYAFLTIKKNYLLMKYNKNIQN